MKRLSKVGRRPASRSSSATSSATSYRLKPENSAQEFSEIFAIYLKNYRDVAIIIGGERIDPATAIAKTWELETYAH